MNLFQPLSVIVLAPFIGSFLGIVAWRLPQNEPTVFGRSKCPKDSSSMSLDSLMPLISYAQQRGRCRACNAPIALLQIAAIIIASTASHRLGLTTLSLIPGCMFGWALLTLAMIDLRSLRLPDSLTLPLLAVGIALAGLEDISMLFCRLVTAIGAWILLAGLAFFYRQIRGICGLGGGDAKLLAAGGAWLGPAILPELVFCAALLTLVGAMIARSGRVTQQTKLPFGPGLAAALWGGWLFETAGSTLMGLDYE